jgi:hypothetical protein
VLPGLFDLHVHTPAAAAPYGSGRLADTTRAHLAAMLRSGVTSALDLGSSARFIFELAVQLRQRDLRGSLRRAAEAVHGRQDLHRRERRGGAPRRRLSLIPSIAGDRIDHALMTPARAPS